MTSLPPPSLTPTRAPAKDQALTFALVVAALPLLWVLSMQRLDLVGLVGGLSVLAFAVFTLVATRGILGLRVVPLLGFVAVIGYCGDINASAVDTATAAGTAIAEACKKAAACPDVPAGFAGTVTLDTPKGALSVPAKDSESGRIQLAYHRAADGQNFILRAAGPLGATWWKGGVDGVFVSLEQVQPSALEALINGQPPGQPAGQQAGQQAGQPPARQAP